MICTRCKQEHNESTKLCLSCKEYRKQYQQKYRKQNVNSKQVNNVSELLKKYPKVLPVAKNLSPSIDFLPENSLLKIRSKIRYLSNIASTIGVSNYWSMDLKQLKKVISIQILKI